VETTLLSLKTNERTDLVLSAAEEASEIYALGLEHWHYSKIIDYLASRLQRN